MCIIVTFQNNYLMCASSQLQVIESARIIQEQALQKEKVPEQEGEAAGGSEMMPISNFEEANQLVNELTVRCEHYTLEIFPDDIDSNIP